MTEQTINERVAEAVMAFCPSNFNHIVEWPDHVHVDGACYALIDVTVAERLWAFVQDHIGEGETYNAEADDLFSFIDPIKHGE